MYNAEKNEKVKQSHSIEEKKKLAWAVRSIYSYPVGEPWEAESFRLADYEPHDAGKLAEASRIWSATQFRCQKSEPD